MNECFVEHADVFELADARGFEMMKSECRKIELLGSFLFVQILKLCVYIR